MNETNNSAAYEVTWLIRRLFRTMASSADRYLQEFDITAADRAVMEFLYPDKQLSVPQIASRYSVSRQHVQVTVNHLQERELLQTSVNPRHKRSSLIELTDTGRHIFTKIRCKDDELLRQIFVEIPETDVLITRATLRSLMDNIKRQNQ